MDEALYRLLRAVSCSQGLVLVGNFNHLDVCWRDSAAIQEVPDSNLLLQVAEEPTRRGSPLDLVLTSNEGLVGSVKVKGSLGRSDHEVLELKVLRAGKVKSKLPALDFRRADWPLERSAWKRLMRFPGRKSGPRRLVNIQGLPPHAEAVHANKEEARQKCHEACENEQEAPGQTQTQRRKCTESRRITESQQERPSGTPGPRGQEEGCSEEGASLVEEDQVREQEANWTYFGP